MTWWAHASVAHHRRKTSEALEEISTESFYMKYDENKKVNYSSYFTCSTSVYSSLCVFQHLKPSGVVCVAVKNRFFLIVFISMKSMHYILVCSFFFLFNICIFRGFMVLNCIYVVVIIIHLISVNHWSIGLKMKLSSNLSLVSFSRRRLADHCWNNNNNKKRWKSLKSKSKKKVHSYEKCTKII